MTGRTLKHYYYKSAKEDYLEAELLAQKQWQQSQNLPEGTKITKTTEGYIFNFPDTSLDWTKSEFKKIDHAYNINPVLGAVAEFGMGATHSFAALGKPIADTVAKATGTKTRDTHYVSPLDVAFEPIGWSPKGSTDILAKRPVFTSGGVAAEVLQTVAMTKAFKAVGTGVKAGVRGGVKQIPKVYSKFTRVFPEEKLVATGTKKIASTKFGQNIYKWGVKGYEPGRGLVFKSGKLLDKKGWRIQTGKYVKHGSRKFMDPKMYAKYKSKLASSGKFNIGFPTSKTDDVIFAAEGGTYKKGFHGVIKAKKYTITKTKDIGYNIPIRDETYYRAGFGSLKDTSGVHRIVEMGQSKISGKSIWLRDVQKMYRHGYPYRFTNLESGKQIIDFTTGMTGSSYKPIGKVTRLRYNLRASKEATASLLKHKTALLQKKGFSTKPVSNILFYAPSTVSTSTIGLGVYGLTKFKSKPINETKKYVSFDRPQKIASFQDVGMITLTPSALKQDVSQTQKLKQKTITLSATKQTKAKKLISLRQLSTVSTIRKPAILLPSTHAQIRYKKKKTKDEYGLEYRFRKYTIGRYKYKSPFTGGF